MKTRFLVLGGVFLLASTLLSAQELKVESFKRLDRDLLARTAQRLDLNDEPCAVVRVSVAKAKSCIFLGNVVGDVAYRPGEAVVYMTKGSRKIVVNSDKHGTIEYEFPERLEKSVTYRLTLVEDKNRKRRTLIMPVVNIGDVISGGAMIASVKKNGFYMKYISNFRRFNADYSITNDGVYHSRTDGGDSDPKDIGQTIWLSGEPKRIQRNAFTLGYVRRFGSKIYMYVGAGGGTAAMGWKTINDRWVEAEDYSYEGIEAEAGFILRMGNYALSAGYQTNQFKIHEASVGFGIMF